MYYCSAEHCGSLKKEACRAVLCPVRLLLLELAHHSAQGLLAWHGAASSKGRKEQSKGFCRPATFEP